MRQRIRSDEFYAYRFWQKVDKSGECWIWTRGRNTDGYGVAHVRLDGEVIRSAHRAAYRLEVGPIPDGLHIDHLCRTRACVRPDHLEPVTPAENNRRVGHAKALHRGKPGGVEDELWLAAQRAADEQKQVLAEEIRAFLKDYVRRHEKKGKR